MAVGFTTREYSIMDYFRGKRKAGEDVVSLRPLGVG